MSEQPLTPQQQQETASRIMHDAELLKQGASFNTLGNLVITESHYVELHNHKPDGIQKVIYNPLEAENNIPMENLLTDAEKLGQLQSEIAEILRPYDGIFESTVPYKVPKGKRRKQESVKWSLDQKTNERKIDYNFTTNYTSDDYGSRLMNVEMAVDGEEIPKVSNVKTEKTGIRYWQKGGGIDKIETFGGNEYSHTVRFGNRIISHNVAVPEHYGDDADAVATLRDFMINTGNKNFELELQGSSPRLIFRFASDPNLDRSYVWNPSSESFTYEGRQDLRRSKMRTLGLEGYEDITMPDEVPRQQYLDILRGLMALIPTMDAVPRNH